MGEVVRYYSKKLSGLKGLIFEEIESEHTRFRFFKVVSSSGNEQYEVGEEFALYKPTCEDLTPIGNCLNN